MTQAEPLPRPHTPSPPSSQGSWSSSGRQRWNADTRFLLTPTRHEADELALVNAHERGGGEVHVYKDRGEGRLGCGLLSVWWE